MRRYSQIEEVESPDMTPMLDIVFIMLIFFIVATSFVKEEAVDWLMLSNMDDGKPKPEVKPLVVTIENSSQFTINNSLVSPESLRARVQSARAKSELEMAVVRVSSTIPTAVLVKAVDDIKLAGIEKVTVGKL